MIAHVYCLAVTHITDCSSWDWANKIQTWIISLYIFPPISCLISYLMTKPSSSAYQNEPWKCLLINYESSFRWRPFKIDQKWPWIWPWFKLSRFDDRFMFSSLAAWIWIILTPVVYLFIFTCLWCFRSLTLWSSSKKQVLTSAFLNNLQPRIIIW